MEELLKQFDLTIAEMNEYKKLNRKVMGVGVAKAMFMVLDFNNPDHKRLNELAGKVIKLNAYLLAHRNEMIPQMVINKF